MLPLCNSHSMVMPVNSCMTRVPHMMVPVMPIQPAAILCPPNNINMCLSSTMTNEYDSRMYGRFRRVEHDHPGYRHAPFDWYKPPKQRYDIVHEDAAVVTLDGAMPIGDFYRHYIYGECVDDDDDDDDDSTSSESDDYDDIQEPRGTNYRRQTRSERNEDERNPSLSSNQQSTNSNHYSTLDPDRRSTVPLQRNRVTLPDNDFGDNASVNSTYGN